MRAGELRCRPRQATCPPGQGNAATPTAREGVKLWGNRSLYATRLCVFAIFGTATSVGHLPKEGSAVANTARRPVSSWDHPASLANFWVEPILHVSRPSGLVVSRKSLERKDAIEEAPSKGAWRATGLHGA